MSRKLPAHTCPLIDSVLDDIDKASGLLNIRREMEKIRDANLELRTAAEEADEEAGKLRDELDEAHDRIRELQNENADKAAEIRSLERALEESLVSP